MTVVSGYGGGGRTLRTNMSLITWSADGSRVAKQVDCGLRDSRFAPRSVILGHHRARPSPRAQFSYELRVNQLLIRHPPAVVFPRLVGSDRRGGTLFFEAVDAAPIGHKYPIALGNADLDLLIAVAASLGSYRPRPRWLRRLPIRARLGRAARAGLITSAEHLGLRELLASLPLRWTFAHGDVSPANVLAGPAASFLVDWEWAGIYPDGYDLAFLWFVLVDMPEARAEVERHVHGDLRVFLLCALVIQLLHLEWLAEPFLRRHLETRDVLLRRLLDPSSLS